MRDNGNRMERLLRAVRERQRERTRAVRSATWATRSSRAMPCCSAAALVGILVVTLLVEPRPSVAIRQPRS